MFIIYICIFFFGASWASFLNATLYRIDNKYKYPDIFVKNSHCEKCGKKLTWIELLPILGYLSIGGKCSSCNKMVSLYYPLSELFLGCTFLFAYLYSIPIHLFLTICFLFILSYFDALYMAISKKLVHIFLAFCIILFFFNLDITNIIAPICISLILIIINLFKKSFGLGDILTLLGIGLLLSYQQFLVMFWLGILIALLYSVIVLIFKKKNIKKAKVPMIPFFTIALLLALLLSSDIWAILLKFLGM